MKNLQRIMCLLSLFVPVVGLTTTFFTRPFNEELQGAPVIIRGIVGKSYADWGLAGDGSSRIYTYTDLQVNEVLKGDVPGKSVLLRELGGEKDGVGMQVAGAAHFEAGSDVVVFTGPRTTEGNVSFYPVHNMSMGRFDIVKDANGNESLTGGALSAEQQHAHFRGAHEGQNDAEHGNEQAQNWTLERVRKELAHQKGALAGSEVQGKQEVNRTAPGEVKDPKAEVSPLQTSLSGGPNSSSRFPWGIGLALLLGGGAGWFLWMRNRKP